MAGVVGGRKDLYRPGSGAGKRGFDVFFGEIGAYVMRGRKD